MPAYELKKHENGIFYIHWTEGRRSKRATTRKATLAEAQRVLGTFLLMDQSADTGRTPDAKITCGEAWTLYVEEHANKKTMNASRNVSAGRPLMEAFGDLPMASVKQAHVDRYVRDRAAGRLGRAAAPGTIWLELNKLVTAFNYAIKKKHAPAADRPDIELPEPPEPRDRWLREDEVRRVLAVAAEMRQGPRLSRLERFLWLALETAARKRVIETLTWAQVDFETGVIHYRKAGDRQTKKKRPSVPISKALMPILRRAYAERTGDLVLDESHKLNALMTRVGAKAKVPGLTPHVLRHTAATWMARRGVPLWKIAGILGNTMLMVEKVYAKHSPEGLADAVDQISGGGLTMVDVNAA